jgi:hypothetical protein
MTKITGIIRGDTRTVNVTFLEDDGLTPINLTGATTFFTVNASNNPTSDTTAALQVIQTSFVSPASGVASFLLTNALTQLLPVGTLYYDTEAVDQFGNVMSSKQDQFIVGADITISV